MKYIAYIFGIAFFRVLSILPRFIIYFISDLLFLVLYYIVGYRKKVAIKNITNSFPDYSEKEVSRLARKFYLHLADIIMESAASLYFSKRRIQKMYTVSNPEIFEKYYKEGRSILVLTAHYGNWEWSTPMSITVQHDVVAVYKPLKNKYFDRAMQRVRGRYGAHVIPMKNITRELINFKNNSVLTVSGMVADQRPIKQHIQYWTDFLKQKTPVFLGTEKLAKKLDSVVLYGNAVKVKRGVYSAEFQLITESPKDTKEYEITDKQFKILESIILKEPAYWLWTHDRWKYKYEDLNESEL